jgi:hypothetical protein
MGILSNIPLYSGNLNELTTGIIQSNLVISKLKTATTIIDIGSATAPSSNQVLTAISSSNAVWTNQTAPSGGGDTFVSTATKTANYTAVKNDEVLVDTNAAAGDITISMPATPTNGDQVRIVLITDHATRVCKVSRNGSNWKGNYTNLPLAGANPEDPYWLIIKGDNITCKFMGGTCGWTVIYDNIQFHSGALRQSADLGSSNGTTITVNFNTVNGPNIGSICDTTNTRFVIRRSGFYNIFLCIQRNVVSGRSYPVGANSRESVIVNASNPPTYMYNTMYRSNGTTITNNSMAGNLTYTLFLKFGNTVLAQYSNSSGVVNNIAGSAFTCKEIR